MNSNEFLASLGEVDNEYVQEAAAVRKASPRRLVGWLAAAAAALAVIAGTAVLLGGLRPKADDGVKTAHTGETAHPGQTAEASATGVPFETAAPTAHLPGGDDIENEDTSNPSENYLIFNGNYYHFMMDAEQPSLFGEPIGEVTKLVNSHAYWGNVGEMIDESLDGGRTQLMPFEEHTGNLRGTIYAVQDYPAEYIVCQKLASGAARVYFNVYGRELRFGRDILEDCFSVSSRFESLSYRSEHHLDRPSGQYTLYYTQLDPELYGERIAAFMEALCDAEYRLEEFPNGLSTADRVAYLRIALSGGMYVNVVLYEDGHAWIYEIDRNIPCGVLCLDKAAAEGIAELVRGKLIFTEYPEPSVFTFEQAAGDPWLGKAVPKRIPDGMEAFGVLISSSSYTELFGKDGPGGQPGDGGPTRYISLQLGPDSSAYRPETGGGLMQVYMEIVPGEDAPYLSEYAFGYYEFVPLEAFGSSDIELVKDEGDLMVYGAFIRVDDAAIRIAVTCETKDAAEAQALIAQLAGSING